MSTRWSQAEETLLAEVWIEVSQEQHTHNDHTFWNRVVDMFNNQTVGNNRNKNMVTGKWARLNCECKRFNAIYNQLQRTSGENDSDRLNNTKTIFEQRYGGRSFQYVHVWEVLRNHPIWLIYG